MRKLIVVVPLLVALAGAAVAAGNAEKDVMAAMETWRQAMLNKDQAAFEKVLHPDLTYGHSSGKIENKAEAIQHVVGSTARYTKIDLTDTKVRVVGSTAVMTGKAEYVERSKDNKDTTINLVVLTVWVKGPRGWQMIARQATKPTPPAAAPAPSTAAK
jgi:ketosteroid isomerase-like protein